MNIIYKIICIGLIFSIYQFSCEKNDNLNNSIKAAGSNRNELQQVLKYYDSRHDTVGKICAVFLIENMRGLSSIDLKTGIQKADLQKIDSKYLIKNIDCAIKASHKDLHNGTLSMSDFCEFVLPHRLGYETLIDWRALCLIKYKNLKGQLSIEKPDYENDIIEVTKTINKELISNFKYNKNSVPAEFRNWVQLSNENTGDCWAMANTITYPLRALGFPVSIDFVTSWTNANGGGHAWNVIINKNKTSLPFLGCEESPPSYSPFRIYRSTLRLPAKVFRKTYSENPESIIKIIGSSISIPEHLNFTRYRDVTDHYLKTKDVVISTKTPAPKLLYLASFTNGIWKPVYWANRLTNNFVFKKMATNSLYIACSYEGQTKIKTLGYPFVIKDNGIIRFIPDLNRPIDLEVKYTQSKELDLLGLYGQNISDIVFRRKIRNVYLGKDRSTPVDGVEYKLYYWKEGWVLTGKNVKCPGKSLTFTAVPSNAIYLVVGAKSKKERAFSYDRSQEWL